MSRNLGRAQNSFICPGRTCYYNYAEVTIDAFLGRQELPHFVMNFFSKDALWRMLDSGSFVLEKIDLVADIKNYHLVCKISFFALDL